MKEFPGDFLWGAATSAHQVEGGNIHNDWWLAEKMHFLKEASGQACSHYELYPEDFAIASSLNHNCHRFSIEWSRIEPQEGNFNPLEIEHYRKVIADLKAVDFQPEFVENMHFYRAAVDIRTAMPSLSSSTNGRGTSCLGNP